MTYPNFSVAMSVYYKDDAIYLDKALYSITTGQTIIPNEIVLVCDGPVGNEIEEVIEKYNNKYPIFTIIRLKNNKGLGNALKIAVKKAKYELIARMDSDDISLPDRFEQQLDFFIKYSDVDIVGGDISEFTQSENQIVGKRVVPTTNKGIYEYMKTRCPMNHVTVMFKKGAVNEAGGYKDWFCNEDYYLWIRMMMKKKRFANTGTILVNVRVGELMYQRRGGKKYFNSEIKLQKYMYLHKIIDIKTYFMNIFKRLIIQVLLPNCIRGWVFRRFCRE